MKKRHTNALKEAYDRIIENPYIDNENVRMLILSDSVTESGEEKFYRTCPTECRLGEVGNVLCHSFGTVIRTGYPAKLEIVHCKMSANKD